MSDTMMVTSSLAVVVSALIAGSGVLDPVGSWAVSLVIGLAAGYLAGKLEQ